MKSKLGVYLLLLGLFLIQCSHGQSRCSSQFHFDLDSCQNFVPAQFSNSKLLTQYLKLDDYLIYNDSDKYRQGERLKLIIHVGPDGNGVLVCLNENEVYINQKNSFASILNDYIADLGTWIPATCDGRMVSSYVPIIIRIRLN